ncbi:Uncharacterized protein Fot_35164 [Forsythia ovata]|uniref:Uncharacterized protein n=1 Tax=Forsythia ovata TaxID=205694 RepID=A0ABD1SLE8_9LAMI
MAPTQFKHKTDKQFMKPLHHLIKCTLVFDKRIPKIDQMLQKFHNTKQLMKEKFRHKRTYYAYFFKRWDVCADADVGVRVRGCSTACTDGNGESSEKGCTAR